MVKGKREKMKNIEIIMNAFPGLFSLEDVLNLNVKDFNFWIKMAKRAKNI